MTRSPALLLILAPALAAAAPVVPVGPGGRIHGDTSEARACLPLDDGGALFGTGGGLTRLDATGATTAVWTAADGLPGTRIDAVVRDGADVWLGTDAGAARVRLAGAALAIGRTLPGAPVRDVARFGKDVYLATWGGGLVRVDARGRAVPVRSGKATRITAVAVAAGALWVATPDALFRLAGGKLVAVDAGAAGRGIASLYGDGERLWIAGTGGLFARTGTTVIAHGGGELRRVTAAGATIVVAGMGDGLARVDRGRLRPLSGAPDGLRLAAALGADGAAACAGGLDGAWLRPRAAAPWRRAAHRVGPPSNDISALATDGARLWVGTFDRGLAVRERGAWRTITHPDVDARINALLVEPDGRVRIGTAAGLMTLDGTAVTRLTRGDGLPGRSVLALARLRDGRLVVGTSSGAVLIGDGRPVGVGPRDIGNVWAVAEDADGGLWLGTTTGLYRGPSVPRADKAGAATDPAWQRFSVAGDELRDDWITALVVHDRTVLAGTYHGGVTRLDLPTADAPIAVSQLGDGWINPGGLRWDGDHLYAATMDGLLIGDGTTATWTRTGGLPGKDVTASVRLGATTWIATRRGLVERAR